MVLDALPAELTPIVQTIDDWNTCRKLGLVFEAQVEKGKLIVCSIDLVKDLGQRPVAHQLRQSLVRYMASPQFAPQTTLSMESLQGLFRQPRWLELQAAEVRASSQQPGYEASQVLDGNPETIWHTPWGAGSPVHPHEIIVDLRAAHEIHGLTCLPRQDMTNGRIAKYEVYVSGDGQDWGVPVAVGEWPNSAALQTAEFSAAVQARYVKLVALSEVAGSAFASAAEIDVVR
jgi:hypothetical protein